MYKYQKIVFQRLAEIQYENHLSDPYKCAVTDLGLKSISISDFQQTVNLSMSFSFDIPLIYLNQILMVANTDKNMREKIKVKTDDQSFLYPDDQDTYQCLSS